MRTRYLIITLLVGCLLVACSQDESNISVGNSLSTSHRISMEEAKKNALDFASKVNSGTRSTKSHEIENIQAIALTGALTRSISDSTNLDTLLYIVNFSDSAGFVIAGTDDRENSIYAYVEDGNYSWEETDSMNAGFKSFIYSLLELKSLYYNNAPMDQIGEGGGGGTGSHVPDRFNVMRPLLVTKWGQDSPYNRFTPNNYPTGCVATAVSQICSFLEVPTSVRWSSNDGSGAATLNWEQIKAECSSYYGSLFNEASKNKIANLMRYWGVAFQADYGEGGTGIDAEDAIDFLQDVSNINVSDLDDYDINSVIADLRQGNKIIFMGGYARYYHVGFVFRKYVDGHAWVVDGYIDEVKHNKQSFYLHCNWGYNGVSNGYFLSNVLDTSQRVYNDNAQTRTNYQYCLETATFTK